MQGYSDKHPYFEIYTEESVDTRSVSQETP